MDSTLRTMERRVAVGDADADDLARQRRRYGLPGYVLGTIPSRYLNPLHGCLWKGGKSARVFYAPGSSVARRNYSKGRWIASGTAYVKRKVLAGVELTRVEIEVVVPDTKTHPPGEKHGRLCSRQTFVNGNAVGRLFKKLGRGPEWWEAPTCRRKHGPACCRGNYMDGLLYVMRASFADGDVVEWADVAWQLKGKSDRARANHLARRARRWKWVCKRECKPVVVWRGP